MTNEQIIRDAINESISRGEIVSVTIRGTDQDLHDAVTATEIGEWDSNGQPDGSIDVYSLDGNPREWRLAVTLESAT